MVNIGSTFSVRSADRILPGAPTDGAANGLGFDRVAATVTQVRPSNATHVSTGLPLTQTIGLVGMRAEHSVGGPFWFGIEAAGAAKGGVAGYAEVLGTSGFHWPVAHRVTLDLRASAGAGGGGDIDTGGGFLLKAAAGATLRLTDTLGVSLESGVSHAPYGHFDTHQVSVALDWVLDPPRKPAGIGWESPPDAEATRTEFATGAEAYRAARKDGSTERLDAVVLQVNRFVMPNLYVSGQAHSAFGGGAGAYSVGLFGLGTQWALGHGLRVGGEALAGAAGGGGVDTGGGAIVQARGYLDVALGETVSLRVGAGKVKSLHGGLDAPLVDAALVFRFGVDRSRSAH
jgi:hypothetical protein